jgi:hypothetical protein
VPGLFLWFPSDRTRDCQRIKVEYLDCFNGSTVTRPGIVRELKVEYLDCFNGFTVTGPGFVRELKVENPVLTLSYSLAVSPDLAVFKPCFL